MNNQPKATMTLPIDNLDRIRLFKIVDIKTGKQVGKPYATRIRALHRADKLDLEYGAVRYVVRDYDDN